MFLCQCLIFKLCLYCFLRRRLGCRKHRLFHRSKPLPPLVFIHGSYHAGWCWAEHWMPFLAAKGYETYSISLRGTSGTLIPGAEVRWGGPACNCPVLVCPLASQRPGGAVHWCWWWHDVNLYVHVTTADTASPHFTFRAD